MANERIDGSASSPARHAAMKNGPLGGPSCSGEAELLAYAFDYEQSTHHRIVPQLEDWTYAATR